MSPEQVKALMTPRTFTDTVDSLRGGALTEEATKELQALNLLCQDTGRAGSITLTITFKPGKGGHFEILDEVKVKKPKAEKGTSLMFPTPEGFLSRNHLKQDELPGLRSVESTPAQVRTLGAA
jgi:hypothetical protein